MLGMVRPSQKGTWNWETESRTNRWDVRAPNLRWTERLSTTSPRTLAVARTRRAERSHQMNTVQYIGDVVRTCDLHVSFVRERIEGRCNRCDQLGDPSEQYASHKRPWNCPREHDMVILVGAELRASSSGEVRSLS
jgi:hypothetical protein